MTGIIFALTWRNDNSRNYLLRRDGDISAQIIERVDLPRFGIFTREFRTISPSFCILRDSIRLTRARVRQLTAG